MAHEDEFKALEEHLAAGYRLLEEGEALEAALRSHKMPTKSDPVWTPGRWRNRAPVTPIGEFLSGEYLIVEQL